MSRVLVAAAFLGSVAFAADLPVVASHLATGPNSHVQLTNTGSQAVNAWSLAITLGSYLWARKLFSRDPVRS